MLENLVQLVRENAQDLVVNNDQVPNEKNEQVIEAASSSITDVLKGQVGSGGIADLISSFTQGGGGNSSAVNQVASNFTDKLSGLGINAVTANSIGAALIPMVMAKFFNKAADPGDSSFNIQDILGKVAGGADGKFDLNDVKDMVGGGSKDGAEGGGMLDKLKGLF